MSAAEIDEYLSQLDESFGAALQALRRMILDIVPDAQQCISDRIPAFRVDGNVIAGFAAFTEHLSYLPFSGSTLASLAEQIDGYSRTKSALHFTPEHSLPREPVEALIDARLAEIERRGQ